MVETIKISEIQDLDYKVKETDKEYQHAVSLIVQKLGQTIIPTVCNINTKLHLLTNYEEVNIMRKYGITEIKCHIISVNSLVEFKKIRLTLSAINSEYDFVKISEEIRELSRNMKVKNLCSTLGIPLELYQSLEVLLDFEWGFTSKKEKKKIINPDKLGIDWDDI